MSLPTRLEGDVYVDGTLTARSMQVPLNSVGDAQVQAGSPGNYVQAEKIRHQQRVHYAQPNVAVVSETKPMFKGYGATGNILQVSVGSIVAATGADTVTVDVKKNGTSILTGVITLNNANTARTMVTGTLATTSYAAGDFFEVVVTANHSTGTLPTGLLVELVVDEDPQ